MQSELSAVDDAEVAGELHQELDRVLILVSEQQVSQRHQQRHHQLITQTRRTTVSEDCVPQHQSLAEGKLSSKQQSEPADAIDLRKYFQLLKSSVEMRIVSLEEVIMNVAEVGDEEVAGAGVLRSLPGLTVVGGCIVS